MQDELLQTQEQGYKVTINDKLKKSQQNNDEIIS